MGSAPTISSTTCLTIGTGCQTDGRTQTPHLSAQTLVLTSPVSEPNTHSCPALGSVLRHEESAVLDTSGGETTWLPKPPSGYPKRESFPSGCVEVQAMHLMLPSANQVCGAVTHAPTPTKAFLSFVRREKSENSLALRNRNGEDTVL